MRSQGLKVILMIIVHFVYIRATHLLQLSTSSDTTALLKRIVEQYQNDNAVKSSHNLPVTESSTLSARTIQTKYGSIKGSLVRFSNQNRVSESLTNLLDVETYLGVPYATPPTGGLRFMPPVTPTHWRGIRLVNRLKPVCPQHIPARDYQAIQSHNESEALRWMPRSRYEYLKRLIPMLGNQSEDCLYLNIYVPLLRTINTGPSMSLSSYQKPYIYGCSSADCTRNTNKLHGIDPKTAATGKLPVLVLIHAESYDWHSANVFDGSILASYGQVIVITLNFRLGVLGFLPAFSDGTIRGNYGLMDQVAALHWIQENIAMFGGSASNVTLIGHGYGAGCAHLLMLSPMSKGLFNRVMLMSGSALSSWAIARNPEYYARWLGKKLGCNNLETMIDCFRSVKIGQLIGEYKDVAPEHLTAFGPIIDSIVVPFDPIYLYHTEFYNWLIPTDNKYVKTDNETDNIAQHYSSFAAIAADPLSLARSYDLLLGITDADTPCLFSDQESMNGVDSDRHDRILRTLVRNLYDYHQQTIFLILYNEYSSWHSLSHLSLSSLVKKKILLDNLNSAISVLTDALVLAPLVRTADIHSESFAQSSHGKTFFYQFNTNLLNPEILTDDSGRSSSLFYDESVSISKRIICPVGHDLAFLFGDPIAHFHFPSQMGPFYYPVNLTETHGLLSQLFMQYIVNFARYGEPNIRSFHFVSQKHPVNGHIRNTLTQKYFWPQYEWNQKNYLQIGSTKPKPGEHRHNHRLSLWLNLIPRLLINDETNIGGANHLRKKYQLLQNPYNNNYNTVGANNNGRDQNDLVETSKHISDAIPVANTPMAFEPYSSQHQQKQQEEKNRKEIYRQHHLLVDYDNLNSYDGIVRAYSNGTATTTSSIKLINLNSSPLNKSSSTDAGTFAVVNLNPTLPNWNVSHNPLNLTGGLDILSNEILKSQYDANTFPNNNESTKWLIIIGVVCVILFCINVAFFIALFYQLKKNRKCNFVGTTNGEKRRKQIEIANIESVVFKQPETAELNHCKAKLIYKTNNYGRNEASNIVEQQNVVNRKGCNLFPYSSNPFPDTELSLQLSSQKANRNNKDIAFFNSICPNDDNKQKLAGADQDLLQSHPTVMQNNFIDRNYVPLINSTTDSTSAYYCLEVNSDNHFESNLNGNGNMKENDIGQQSFTSTTYREMSV